MTLDDLSTDLQALNVLFSIGMAAYDKLKAIQTAKNATDADLDTIIAAADARLKARGV